MKVIFILFTMTILSMVLVVTISPAPEKEKWIEVTQENSIFWIPEDGEVEIGDTLMINGSSYVVKRIKEFEPAEAPTIEISWKDFE